MNIRILQWKRAVCAVLFTLLLSVVGMTNATAQTFTVGDLNYSVNEEGSTVTVTGHVDGQNATGELVIPENVEQYGSTYLVTKIGDEAFYNCYGLTGSLIIPETVIYIGSFAFMGCGIETLTISSDIYINWGAFWSCSLTTLNWNAVNGYVYYSPGSSPSHCFEGCPLSTLNIGENVQVIPEGFLAGFPSITGELVIPQSVTTIGSNAFYGCSGFSGSLTLGNSITSIGENAFSNCIGFSGSLTIPNNVTSIGANAFSGCSGFSGTLTLGNSLLGIGNSAFFGSCGGFTSMEVKAMLPPTLGMNVFASANYDIPVTVPCGTSDAYQSASGWSSFTNIQEPNPCLWTITATAAPTNGGTITGAGTYEQGQTCTLTATPKTGASFVNWTEDGVEVSTEAQYAFTVTENRDLVAHFIIPTYAINVIVNPSDGGSVAYDGGGEFSPCDFEDGSIPAKLDNSVSSYPWTIWSSNAHDGSYCMASNNINVDNSESAIETTVEFVEDGSIAFWWRISSESNYDKGFFYINGEQQFQYSGSYGWNSYSIDLSAGTYTFRWSYQKDISQSSNEDRFFIDDITFTGAVRNEYQTGQTCTLTATPSSSDFVFLNWTENGNVVSTNAQYSFTVTNDRNLVANFNQIGCEITASANPETLGTVSGGGHYTVGQTCTLTATPNEGYSFVNWTENNEIVSTNATYSFTATTHRNLVAHFRPSNAIFFLDPNVETICLNNWDTDGDGYLSYDEAATVTNLGNVFEGNNSITSFNELQYFTGLTSINGYEFWNCSNLASVVIPTGVTSIGEGAFGANNQFSLNLTYNATNCSGVNESWLYNCTLTNLTIGDNVQVIPDNFIPNQSNLVGTLTIPASVTYIGGSAFANCTGFTGALTLPASLTSIGGSAFANCTGFTGTLTIPATVTSIGDSAFENCAGFTGTLTIPEAVTSIGRYAFAGTSFTTLNFNAVNCGSLYSYGWYNDVWAYRSCLVGLDLLTTLNIGSNVQTIPDYAFKDFSGCTGGLVIPNSVTSIGNYAFSGCTGFTNLTMGSSVTTIGSRAFENCSGFTGNLSIPEGVETIGERAFVNCSGFSGTLTIPTTITSIGNCAFNYCGFNTLNYNAINCEDFDDNYIYSDDGEYLGYVWPLNCGPNLTTLNIGNQVQRIPRGAFANSEYTNNPLRNSFSGTLTIPSSVTSIGGQAFDNCVGFTGSLVIPNSVTTIDYYAFSGCTGFTGSLVIPNSVTYISELAFGNCTGFDGTVTIGENVENVYGNAFTNTNFNTMNYNATNAQVGEITEWGEEWSITFVGLSSLATLNFGENVQSISKKAFMNCSSLTGTLTFPNSLTTIDDQAFYNCYGLEGIVMGNSVETIGSEAFRNCGGLRGELTLPETLQSVGIHAFASCDELNTINYNAINCTEMGNAQSPVFYDCASIEHINIGENVESMPNYAFKRCSTVTDMTVAAVVPPTIEASTFGTVSRAIPVNVPFGSGDAYRSAPYWQEFFNIIEGIGENTYTCHWNATANPYAYNMTAVGIIQINGVEQATDALEIGAFCGNECRGSQMLAYYSQVDRYLVFLTLYGEPGDLLTFKLYDHELGQESVLGCDSFVTFESDGILGTYNNPYVFNFTTIQNTTLNEGWTWYSSYVELGSNSLQMMEESLGDNGVMIKSQSNGFVTNDEGSWMGSLHAVNNESMYLINTSAPCVLSMTGDFAVPSQHPITLLSGWTWTGYPSAKAVDLNEALVNLNATDGDIIKAKSCFAIYADGSGWFGSLHTLNPGVGLMYHSLSNQTQNLVYGEGSRGFELRENLTAERNHFVPSVANYPYNMSVMAVVNMDGEELSSENYELAAFANGECRGSAKLMYIAPLDRYMAFLTVAGDDATQLSFGLYDASNGTVCFDTDDVLTYSNNTIAGSMDEPYMINFRETTGANEFASRIRIYPNPVSRDEVLNLVMPTEDLGKARVEIVNAFGQTVSSVYAPSTQTIAVPETAGVYLLRVTVAGKGTYSQKIVVR